MRTVSFFGWSGPAMEGLEKLTRKSPTCHYPILLRKM
jgi:hypothetical protein